MSAAPPQPHSLPKPIEFYGTAITRGACASRPDMPYTARLGRRFDRSVINLGFFNDVRMELQVAELVAELDAALLVIDSLPNFLANILLARTKPCVQVIRQAHRNTPILLAADRTNGDAFAVCS